MTTFIFLALLVAVTFVALWYQMRIAYWAILSSIPIAAYLYASINTNDVINIIVIVVLISIILLVSIPVIRRKLISKSILKQIKSILPKISQTELDALEAGTVWWDKEIFNGSPNWNELFSIKITELSKQEKEFINGPVNDLCQMLDDWKITHDDADLPKSVWEFMSSKGFFGMIIPKKYGGLEFSALAHSAVVMKIASRSVSAAVTVMVPNSLGPAELLLRYGTDEQQQYYLPRLAKGIEIPCFALTEPNAGSDAGGLTSSGVVCKQVHNGKEQMGIRLNWEKRYITLGPVATLLGLAFRLYDPEHLIGDEEDLGITLAIIPTDIKGIEIGERHIPLDMAFQNGPNRGHDVFITMDKIIGGQEYVGGGWKMLMDCLAAGRSISLPALATGAGKLASRLTGAYCHIRRQFKVPLDKLEGIQSPLARIAAYTYMLDATRKLTATAIDIGEQPSVISAIIKYQHTEHMRQIVNDAMDIHGGSGICLGPQNLLGRMYQAIPISITVEGANILTRSLIIYGQGALRCHPWLFQMFSAANESNLRDFDQALFGLVGGLLSKIIRAPILALGFGHLIPVTGNKSVDKYLHKLTRLSASFALISDCTILLLGSSLKRKEALSGRFADALGMLYLASATIKKFHDEGSPNEAKDMLEWTMQYCNHNIEKALFDILRNLPNRFIAATLHVLCFPTGKHFSPPRDQLTNKLTRYITTPGEFRDKLTQGIFISTDKNDPLATVDRALIKVTDAESIERKLRMLVKENKLPNLKLELLAIEAVNKSIISEHELKRLKEAEQLRSKVVAVDSFPSNLMHRRARHGIKNNIG